MSAKIFFGKSIYFELTKTKKNQKLYCVKINLELLSKARQIL